MAEAQDSSATGAAGVAEPAKAAKPPKRGKWRKRLLIAVPVAVALYALIGFFVVPWVAQRWVVPMIAEQVNGDITVDRIATNPFTLSLTLEGATVTDEFGTRVLGLDRLYGNLQVSSLFREGFVLRATQIEGPYALVVLKEDGTVNLAKLMKPSSEPSTEPITLPRVRGEGVTITGVTIDFVDRMTADAPKRTISPVNFTLDPFDTQPQHFNQYRFTIETEASEAISGEGGVYLNPLDIRGTLAVDGFDLPMYAAYKRLVVPVNVNGGKVDVRASYELVPAAETKVAAVGVESVTVSGLDVSLPSHPLITASELSVQGVAADAVARTLKVEKVGGDGIAVTLKRADDGNIELLDIITSLTSAPSTPDAQPDVGAMLNEAAPGELVPLALADSVPEPYDDAVRGVLELINASVEGWAIGLEAVEIADTAATWRDAAVEPTVELGVTQTRFTAGPLESDDLFATDFTLETQVNGGGPVSLVGRVEPESLSASLAILSVENLPLAPAAPYLKQIEPRLVVTGGQLQIIGQELGASMPKDAPMPEVAFTDLTIGGFIDAQVSGFGPTLDVPVRNLDLRLAGLDTAANREVALNFKTQVYNGGVSIEGGKVTPNLVDPLRSKVDLTLNVTKFELRPLSPVSGEYVGKAIQGGAFTTGLDLDLTEGQLDANFPKLTVEEFDFGEKVESENATSLPVGLAVAVLKGPSGTINISSVRISGDLTDPKVSLGNLVYVAVENLITGIAAAPFQMLGGLVVPGGEDGAEPPDLSFVAFAPGRTELDEDARTKLDLLTDAFKQRPQLAMAVAGVPTRDLDEPSLRRQAFVAEWRRQAAASLPAGDLRRADPASIAVSDEQYRQAVRFAHAAMTVPPSETQGTPAQGTEPSPEAVADSAYEVAEPRGDSSAATTDAAPNEAPTSVEPEAVDTTDANEAIAKDSAEPQADSSGGAPPEETMAADERLEDEPVAFELSLPELAEDGGSADAGRSARSRSSSVSGEPRRRLRAGRSMHSRVSRASRPDPVRSAPTSEESVARVESTVPETPDAEPSENEPRPVAHEAEVEQPASESESDTVESINASDLETSAAGVQELPEAEPLLPESEPDASGLAETSPVPSMSDEANAEGQPVPSGTVEPAAPVVPFDEAERAVLARVPLDSEAFVRLRRQRVAAVVEYLVQAGGLPATRVSAGPNPAEPDENSDRPDVPRVVFKAAENTAE